MDSIFNIQKRILNYSMENDKYKKLPQRWKTLIIQNIELRFFNSAVSDNDRWEADWDKEIMTTMNELYTDEELMPYIFGEEK